MLIQHTTQTGHPLALKDGIDRLLDQQMVSIWFESSKSSDLSFCFLIRLLAMCAGCDFQDVEGIN